MKIWRATPTPKNSNDYEVVASQKQRTQSFKEAIDADSWNVEDARNDLSPKMSSRKERKSSSSRHKITVGRNPSYDVMREMPESPDTRVHPSLSRLLFSKQTMEQRDQLKVVYHQFGPSPTDVLIVESEDGMPSPEAPDHVVIKVQVRVLDRNAVLCCFVNEPLIASFVSFTFCKIFRQQASTVSLEDCLIRRGFDFNVWDPICLPQTPGFDVVGHICACGSQVDPQFADGDRVAVLLRTGGNARFVSVPSRRLVKIPRNIDSAEAVALVTTFTTAYQTLKRITQKGPMFSLLGKRVLILGGMDGVGRALIQMCLKARAEIYAPCPRSCHTYMKNVLGAHPLPEDKDQWLALVETQMDYVFDGVCEDGLESSQKALTAEGELVCFGHTSMLKESQMGLFGAPLTAHLNRMWSQTKSKVKVFDIWDSFNEDPDTYKVSSQGF
jgi:NADPH:quinone reductase-like Zn-dependent oxidoreductase